MVVDARDPVTGTQWLSSSNYSGSVMKLATGALGFGLLGLVALIGWFSIAQPGARAVESASGGLVNAGGGRKVDF